VIDEELKGIIDSSESLVAERIEQAVTAEVQISNVAFEDNLAVDFEPQPVPIADWNQLHHQVTVPQQYLLQTLKPVCSMRNDPIGQVGPVVYQDLGKLGHF